MIRKKLPSYGLHKPTGQARTIIAGKHHYLGAHGSPESWEKYHRLVTDHLSPNGSQPPPRKGWPLSINELIERFADHASHVYVGPDGKPTDEQAGIRAALFYVHRLFGTTAADQFGPKSLKLVIDELMRLKRKRSYIRDCLHRIRRMFKWAVSEELLPASVHQALLTVEIPRRGQWGLEESTERTVPPEVVTPTIRTMIRVQLLTGMRPQDLRNMRACDIDHSGDVWVYEPVQHKNRHRGMTRRIAIGPRAQRLLYPYLDRRSASDYVFSPYESRKEHLARRRTLATSPRRRLNHEAAPTTVEECTHQFNKRSYGRAITRACQRTQVAAWTPMRLRHTCASRVRRRYGVEAAAAVLGNSLGLVVEVYAESNFTLAKKVMKEMG